MGLKNVFQAVGKAGFAISGDIKRLCTYVYVDDDGINEVTETEISVEALPSDFSLAQISGDDNLQPGDTAYSILFVEMPSPPQYGDRIIDGMNVFTVINYTLDPAEVMYELHLRKA